MLRRALSFPILSLHKTSEELCGNIILQLQRDTRPD